MTTETAGPVERWMQEVIDGFVFDGVPRALNNSLRFARQIDERVRMLVEALWGYRREHNTDAVSLNGCFCALCKRADAALASPGGGAVPGLQGSTDTEVEP